MKTISSSRRRRQQFLQSLRQILVADEDTLETLILETNTDADSSDSIAQLKAELTAKFDELFGVGVTDDD